MKEDNEITMNRSVKRKQTKKEQTTRRKMKIRGEHEYINAETGEIKKLHVIEVEERDANFDKIWLGHIIEAIGLIGNKKMNLVLWLMKEKNSENQIVMTYKQIAEKSGISEDTVNKTMRLLLQNDFLRRVNMGAYQINPDIIFKGGKSKRFDVLLSYQNLSDDLILPDEEEDKDCEAEEVLEGQIGFDEAV